MPGHPSTVDYSNAISHLYEKISYNFTPKFTATSASEKIATPQAALGEIPRSHKDKKQEMISGRNPSDSEKPKIMLATVSANDAYFDEEKQNNLSASASIPPAEMIEFIPAGEVINVAQSMQQEHKIEAMDRVRNDATIRDDVRRSILAKLEKVTDFVAYYKQNIAHYEMQARRGSLHAKRILPDLHKLLHDAELKTLSSNDSNIARRRAG